MLNIYQDLAIPTRRAILAELLGGPKNVSAIVQETGLKQPNVSNHLAKMRQSKTVKASRIGREIYYAFGGPDIEEAVRASTKVRVIPGSSLDLHEMAEQYVRAATMGLEVEVAEIVDSAVRNNVSLLELYEELISRAMAIVGVGSVLPDARDTATFWSNLRSGRCSIS